MESKFEGDERKKTKNCEKVTGVHALFNSDENAGNKKQTKLGGKQKKNEKISKEFPNFTALTKEERLAFFEALSTARKNVEKTGARTRERFGTIHDEYLQYFENNRQSPVEEVKEKVSSISSSSTQATYTLTGFPGNTERSPSRKSIVSLPEEVASEDLFLLQNSSEFISVVSTSNDVTNVENYDAEPPGSSCLFEKGSSHSVHCNKREEPLISTDMRVWEECESILANDRDKILDLYLRKKRTDAQKFLYDVKENEVIKLPKSLAGEDVITSDYNANFLNLRNEVTAKKVNKENIKPETSSSREIKKEIELFTEMRETPRFDALDADEKEIFFNILKEAHDNVLQKTPHKKVLAFENILKRYQVQDKNILSYSVSTDEDPKQVTQKDGKNLRVKLTVTSTDNQRLKAQVSDGEKLISEKQMQRTKFEAESTPIQSSIKRKCSFNQKEQEAEQTSVNDSEDVESIEDSNKSQANTQETKEFLENEKQEGDTQESSQSKAEIIKDGKSLDENETKFTENQIEFPHEQKEITKNVSKDSLNAFNAIENETEQIEKPSETRSKENNKKSPAYEEFDKEEENPDKINNSKASNGKKNEEVKDPEFHSIENGNRSMGKNKTKKSNEGNRDNRAQTVNVEEKDGKKGVKIKQSTTGKKSKTIKNHDESFNVVQLNLSTENNDDILRRKSEKVKVAVSKKECKIKSIEKERMDFGKSSFDGKHDRNKTRSESALELDFEAQQIGEKKIDKTLPSEKHSFEIDETTKNLTEDLRRYDKQGTPSTYNARRILPEHRENMNSKEDKELKQVYDSVTEFSPGKLVLMDDSAIQKITQLIQDLEKKAKQEEDYVGNEYVHLLLNYIDYLSKVLHSAINAKVEKSTKDSVQVRTSLTSPEVYLKFEEKKRKALPPKQEADANISRPANNSAENIQHSRAHSLEDARVKDIKLKGNSSSLLSLSPSTKSSSADESENENLLVPMFFKKKRLPTTKIRVLQDLLKGRSEFVEGSISDFKIVKLPQIDLESTDTPIGRLHVEEEEEIRSEKGTKSKFFKALVRLCKCGKKETVKEDNILENLKGEAVAVDISKGTKNPASVTLNESTMEVLKAAQRKKIIQKYWKTT